MTAPTPRAGILEIRPYVPGRDGSDDGRPAIKLSSNESALGPSPHAIAAARRAVAEAVRYPDGAATRLREAIARHHGLDASRIVCGNGSDELLEKLAQAYAGPGDEVLYSRHGFAIYPIAARAAGARPVAAAECRFRTDVDAMLAAASERTKLVFLANPNNPTGSYITTDELARLRQGLPEGALLAVDAAYAEFVAQDDYSDGLALARERDDTVMTRTFSKIYSLAGLRVGWLYGPAAIVDALHRVRPPFNVNAPAQAAAQAALADGEHLRRARQHNARGLARLASGLSALGLTVHDSVANFVLLRFPGGPDQARAALDWLAERRIFVRGLDGYGIADGLRVNIGLDRKMEAVEQALAAFMASPLAGHP